MIKLLAPALTALTLAVLCGPVLSQEKDDLASALDGEWEVVEMIYRGKVQDFGGQLERIRFKDGKVCYGSKNDRDLPRELFGEYLWTTGKPFSIRRGGEIDVDYGDRVLKGLYELKDGTLRIIEPEDFSGRPADFGAVADPGLTLRVLKRVAK
jgi:hypothetical protein